MIILLVLILLVSLLNAYLLLGKTKVLKPIRKILKKKNVVCLKPIKEEKWVESILKS